VFILKVVKVLCFDTLLQVFILKVLTSALGLVRMRLHVAQCLSRELKNESQQDTGISRHKTRYYPLLTVRYDLGFVKEKRHANL
jgi:hypothetical protein